MSYNEEYYQHTFFLDKFERIWFLKKNNIQSNFEIDVSVFFFRYLFKL